MGLLKRGRSRWLRALTVSLVAASLLVPWVTTRAAGELLVTINQVKKEDFPALVAYITVSDQSGIPVAGLSEVNFEAFEDGDVVPALAVSTAIDSQEGIAVILAIDTSGSMKGQPIEDAKEAARSFIGDLTPDDQGAIISFSAKVDLLQDFTGVKADLNAGIEALKAAGDTALYDAIYDAVGHASRLPPGRKMILILTDGEDTESSVTLDDAIGRARELNVPVFAVALGQVVADPLKRLTKLTGGRYFEALSSAELTERFKLISDQLRHQYVVSYRSQAPPDGQDHILVVKVTHEGKTGEDSRTFIATPIKPSIALPGFVEEMEVAGVVEITPDIQPPDFVAQVEYSLDGQVLAGVDQSPFTYRWDAAQVALGEHTLSAVVLDQAGNKAQTVVRLRVVPLLEVGIASPSEGAVVSGKVNVEPSIEAFHPLGSVEYLLDGKPLAAIDQAPFTHEVDLAGVTAGEHTLVLRVRDSQGNTAEAARTVKVVLPLTVRITSPGEGAEIEGEATLSVNLMPAGVAERVEYLLDGQSLAVVEEAPFGYRWDAAGVEAGSYVLTAKAYGQGQVAQDQVEVTVVYATLPWGMIFALAVIGAAAIPLFLAARRRKPAPIPSPVGPTREMAAPPMRERGPQAWLVEKGAEGRLWELRAEGTILGRAVGPEGVVIDDPLASRQHAEIKLEGEEYVFQDLAPTNPSLLNGVEYQGPHRLEEGDEVTIGNTTLVFKITR
jgi:VWFA-related protein